VISDLVAVSWFLMLAQRAVEVSFGERSEWETCLES